MMRRIRRLFGRKLAGCSKSLALLCFSVVAVYLYLNRSRSQFVLQGVKDVWDANGVQSLEKGASCGVVCGIGQKSFYVKTGTDNTIGPTICYNGKIIISPDNNNGGRGLNMLVIDIQKMEVTDVKTFDTYTDDAAFLQYMKKAPKNAVILLVTHDEITERLSNEGRQWFRLMGSYLIDNVGFRDAFVLVGQIGLEQKQAIEFHKKREHGGYSLPIEKKGCFSLPFGPLRDISQFIPKVTEYKMVVEKLDKCGLTTECGGDKFSVMVDTGDGDQRKPTICINGEIVLGEKVNHAGRGFNVAVLSSAEKKVSTVTVFDTYEKDSSSMEVFLENLVEGDIVVAVVNDDGQRKLSTHARDLYNQLGSSMIQNLRFRDVWYFVGKKGIKGFTSTEQISFAGYDGSWPTSMKDSFCLPYNLKGTDIPPTPKSKRNEARREFCKKYDGYEHLCDPAAVDETLQGVELVDRSHANDGIFKVPIVIIPGLVPLFNSVNHNAIVRTMETTLMQPGIKPNMVLVAYDENFPEYGELSTLFGFHNISVKASTTYVDVLDKAIEAGWDYFDVKDHIIIIEEELILAPDFLSFMQQCLNVFDSDPTILAVSGWNYNGYDVTSGDREAVYRVEEFPGLAFMLRRNVVEKYMLGKLSKCCHKRVWDHWILTDESGNEITGDVIVPDVSRVFHQPYQSAKDEDKHLVELFQKPRLTNVEGDMTLKNMDDLSSEKYDALIQSFIENSEEFSLEHLQNCIQDPVLKVPVVADSKPNFVIFYHQTNKNDYAVLKKISRCFGLFWVADHPPRNQFRGVIRFYYDDRNVLLVGSSSKFYKYKLETRYLLTVDNVGKS
ncbi:protein O-linked-mannose beta-1,2-N-acetylglucosaminyltransferase 1-like isoform X1 [Mytilus californianus]|uniref:protein O-linked-mannose beta-1,2-N-acetylglucosaminyltransferase 1-like isoform X1 n=1 Tax=Mytilus californianus TaxID=6549 RepID=UPI002246BD61|nr:protein O-linked-mannose beta-1,2-N-acetylglucosaminyltransferase 1-like isoform X1 [Mytilus californianus]